LYLRLIPLPRSCRRLHRQWRRDHSLERAPRYRVTSIARGLIPNSSPFRDRGQIRRAVNSKLVFATLRRRLPSHAIVPMRCLRGRGHVCPLVHLDLTVVMVIDETCSSWCVGDRNRSLWEANGCAEHYIRWGIPYLRGTPIAFAAIALSLPCSLLACLALRRWLPPRPPLLAVPLSLARIATFLA
jgi:hypothetical protein